MAQLIINKDGKPVCRTTVPYDPQTIRSMKRAGYKIKEVPDESVLRQLSEPAQDERAERL